ncbi:MAG: hypothetical protein JW768_09160 [Chitinispirillaceae bacterium]|nr:hypothetical protein [Chitinispirillaceae bacterium]
MGSKRCRLYDENLVHNIMLSTSLSVVEFMREHNSVDSDDVCDFVEANADSIINDTIRHLKKMGSADDQTEDDTKDGDTGEWPIKLDD